MNRVHIEIQRVRIWLREFRLRRNLPLFPSRRKLP